MWIALVLSTFKLDSIHLIICMNNGDVSEKKFEFEFEFIE